MAYELISFPNDDALANAVAERWLKVLAKRHDRVAPYTVALSGGRVAQKFFAAVAAKGSGNLEWFINVHFFWADERCVPPDHADSNYRVAEAELFAPLKIPAFQIHRLRGETEPTIAGEQAGRELQETATGKLQGVPQLDLVFLGMGEDAHVASLFPGDQDKENPAWFRPVIGPKPPPQRLTMGYSLLAQAKEVWVLASGKAKADALKDSVAEGSTTPLGRVLASRGKTLVFSDVAA
ncbi:MAG: 6-phosphogluconolactonase [Verrucomicrobia bacterium]|nr:6-phosphogluconolactonase [Verrucomicrobiota bacterium]